MESGQFQRVHLQQFVYLCPTVEKGEVLCLCSAAMPLPWGIEAPAAGRIWLETHLPGLRATSPIACP
jgi:hypothetical protein